MPHSKLAVKSSRCLQRKAISATRRRVPAHTIVVSVAVGALLDAGIACWDAKRTYDSVRPVTAIHFLFAGREVLAWAGPGLGTRRIRGEEWQPYLATPPFPEYVSGHSTFSAAAATVLARFTGSDRFGANATIPAGSSGVEPGATPAADVVLDQVLLDRIDGPLTAEQEKQVLFVRKAVHAGTTVANAH